MASIRIVSADYYMSYPNCDLDVVYSEFRGTEIRQVPIIQIFGSTKEGKKTCLNIHGVFPYVYIPYDGNENAGVLSYKIASELDKTINISLGQGSSNTCHVHNIILASGVPIYGYHEKQHQFFKIYFYNPAIIKKACNLLENGAILGKCFQPHESHISYILQFMVDYNLHGMSFLNVAQVKYRPNPKYPDQLNHLPKDKVLPVSVQRRSVCELEMDCFACDILNTEEILTGGCGKNPGIAALWEDEKQRRRDKNQDSQISFCLSQERDLKPEPTTSHQLYAQRLVDKLVNPCSDDTISELDNSVYPAETPDDVEYTITPANLTDANTSMFEDTLIPDAQQVPQHLSQTDRNLLEILKELKENVHIDEDSVLSQQNPEPAEVTLDDNAEDEEENLLSNPLGTLDTFDNVDLEIPNDIWDDTIWTNDPELLQVDGSQLLDLFESGTSGSSTSTETFTSSELRFASEVFITNTSKKLSRQQQLNPGVNTLVTTEPSYFVPEQSRVKILSDMIVSKEFEKECCAYDMNEIILNDVNMGNMTPTRTTVDASLQLSPKTPHAHTNQCSCRQSPCNNSGNRLFSEDSMNLFNDELYENNSSPSTGTDKDKDKENVAVNQQQNIVNSAKRNLKLVLAKNNYNLRSLETTPKDKTKRCCRLCTEHVQCPSKAKSSDFVNDTINETETKVKTPQLKLRELLTVNNKRETKSTKNTKNTNNTGNKEQILVQIPLVKIFRRRGRPKKLALSNIDTESTCTSLSASTSTSTCSSSSCSSYITPEILIKKLKKLQLMNWNLDGQNDTPSSDSEHSQKNGLTKTLKTRTRTRSGGQPKFRVSGLQKKSHKKNKTEIVDEKLTTNEQIELTTEHNGNITSPRLLRNRKSNISDDTNLRKRKSEIIPQKSNFEISENNDEFKENKVDVNLVKAATEQTNRPVLRNKSKYSQAERNLKRQKRLSLSLKHLREREQEQPQETVKPEDKNTLKELRVSLTQTPIDKLININTNNNNTANNTIIKDLKIILEPLSPKLLEKYSSKSSLNESSPQLQKIEENQRNVEENATNSNSNNNINNNSNDKKRATRQSSNENEAENKRVTRQSSNSNVSSDSCENIVAAPAEVYLKTPPKKLKTPSIPSPKKYPPLNVTRSPRQNNASKAPLTTEDEIEPLKKRLRNFDANVSDQDTTTKKVKTSALVDDRAQNENARGIGELQDYPIIHDSNETKIPEIVEIKSQCETLVSPQRTFKNCNNLILSSSPRTRNRSINSPLKTPDSIRTNLFNTTPLNTTANICPSSNNNKALVEYKTFWKKRDDFDNIMVESNAFKTPPKLIPLDNSNNLKTPEKLYLSSTEKIFIQSPNNSNITPKKSIITSADYLDYSPFASPEKGTVNLPFLFNSRETLSQQCEKELEDDSIQNYTKTKNLTIAEKYDLLRDYAPQPGTSKDESYCDVVIDDCLHFEFSQDLRDDKSTNSNIWMPKYYPPSIQDIRKSLADYNIPEHEYETPFYGNASDVTRKVDVGNNMLKIPSKTISDLDEFKSCLGYEGLEQWRRDSFKQMYPNADLPKSNLYASLVGHSQCIIQPIKPPPTKEQVLEWLQSKVKKEQEKESKPEKIRIVIPSSPGNNYNEDSDVSFTLSPDVITPTPPKDPKDKKSPYTPLSSPNSSPCLRSRRNTRRGTLQRKVLFSAMKSSQDNFQNINLNETTNMNNSCQITGVTLNNTHGFKLSYENLQNAKALNENQHLTILVIEVHVRTRGDLNPDPQHDAIRAIFYSIYNDVPCGHHLPKEETGVIAVNTLPQSPSKKAPPPILNGLGLNCNITYVPSELEAINSLVSLIHKWDPDIFSGFEIELLSWGYVIERCYTLSINLPAQISRTNPEITKKKTASLEPSNEELKLSGRIILDAWRLFRHEVALTSYTFENLMYHILHQRVPHHSFKNLSFWWDHRTNHYRKITAEYYINRTQGVLKLMDQLDLIGRTAELARLFGIQFYEVFSRGSQFRVESMMFRLAKPLNYICVSPSVQQRAKMRAPEWIPLIFEPESRFYVDPIIVLDFQSLYPSIIIAYNYCFSTCVGRIEKLGSNQPFEFGATQLRIPRKVLNKLDGDLTFSPCGVGFVTSKIRKGILPRMLQEILETRLMVKASMKQNKGDKLLQRVLHSRQLGLKLIANVTYGYTAANFSGRMPCSEVGDSVVSKGRETLERAIRLIEKCDKWKARVVYGDTDSLFVQVAGRSREDAFKIGQEIADAVTRDNPAPVKLKLEKVYQPCILQTKKRYVGYMYESPEQETPEYNAKGIETVRRDGCPAVAKMLEKTLRILFESRDVSLVKRYVCHQFEKILTGRASVQDLIFAREYRGAGGYRPGACVPALELARRWTAVDKRKEPRRGERVPYIIVHGPPGVPLIRLVRCPRDLLNMDNQQVAYRPNAIYYITKVIIPPLNRCLSLIGADVNTWYNEMPRKQLQILPTDIHFEKSKKSTISEYFATMNCAVCDNQTREGLCDECLNRPQRTIVSLQEKIHKWERSCYEINQICESCCGRNEQTDCTSLDCPILYRLIQSKRDLKQVPFLRNLFSKF